MKRSEEEERVLAALAETKPWTCIRCGLDLWFLEDLSRQMNIRRILEKYRFNMKSSKGMYSWLKDGVCDCCYTQSLRTNTKKKRLSTVSMMREIEALRNSRK